MNRPIRRAVLKQGTDHHPTTHFVQATGKKLPKDSKPQLCQRLHFFEAREKKSDNFKCAFKRFTFLQVFFAGGK